MKKWKLWTGLVTLFLSGVVIGSAGAALYMKDKMQGLMAGDIPAVRNAVMKKLSAELKLSEEQRVKVDEIVCEVHLEMLNLRRKHRPEAEEIIGRGIARMKMLLRPDQQKKLDELYEKARKRWDLKRGDRMFQRCG